MGNNREGIKDEYTFRLLSTDLHQMRQAYNGKGLGGHYETLAKCFDEKDFFPPGDEDRNNAQFPNLALFFSTLAFLDFKKNMSLEKRIADWKIVQEGDTSFDAFFDYITATYCTLKTTD